MNDQWYAAILIIVVVGIVFTLVIAGNAIDQKTRDRKVQTCMVVIPKATREQCEIITR